MFDDMIIIVAVPSDEHNHCCLFITDGGWLDVEFMEDGTVVAEYQ